jgi:hypothetical protein
MNNTTIEAAHRANGSGARTDIAAFATFFMRGELIDIRLFWD